MKTREKALRVVVANLNLFMESYDLVNGLEFVLNEIEAVLCDVLKGLQLA